mmetsp:Transcript_6845/g.25873  ORF Transcript_6845/g.25873 Transcript_6845/m.25873 type:complete len:201 (-) Transcript_6845:1043-1645(-)
MAARCLHPPRLLEPRRRDWACVRGRPRPQAARRAAGRARRRRALEPRARLARSRRVHFSTAARLISRAGRTPHPRRRRRRTRRRQATRRAIPRFQFNRSVQTSPRSICFRVTRRIRTKRCQCRPRRCLPARFPGARCIRSPRRPARAATRSPPAGFPPRAKVAARPARRNAFSWCLISASRKRSWKGRFGRLATEWKRWI